MSAALGMSVPDWSGRRAQDALAEVRRRGRRRKAPCVICGQPIDYSLSGKHPEGCTVQHIKSRKLFPALTWDPKNWAPAHGACNQSAGTGEQDESIGVTSQEW